MKLFTEAQLTQLKANAAEAASNDHFDPRPVVKLFTPDGSATWLLAEYDEENDIAFGLCDLGLGFPELGYVDMQELRAVRGKLGLPVERDLHFTANKSLSEYANQAHEAGRLVA